MQKDFKLFKRLILLFTCILVPIVSIAGIALYSNNQSIRHATLLRKADTVENTAAVLDDAVERLYRDAVPLLSDENVVKLGYQRTYLNAYEQAFLLNNIRDKLTVIKENNAVIESARMFIYSEGKIMNSSGYKKGSMEYFTPEMYDMLLEKTSGMGSAFSYEDGQFRLYLVNNTGKAGNIIELNFSASYLAELLRADTSEGSGCYLLSQKELQVDMTDVSAEGVVEAVDNSSGEGACFEVASQGERYFVFRSQSLALNADYYHIVPTGNLFHPLELSYYYTVLFFIATLICFAFYFWVTFRIIHKPFTKLIDAFGRVECGDWEIRVEEGEGGDFSYLYRGFNKMTANLSRLINDVYKQKILLQSAELKQLQAQINPHFLYNSFFMLQRMMKRGMMERAVKVSKELGIYFNYLTRNEVEEVPLLKEYEHGKIYCNIQSLRFEGRIAVEIGALPVSYHGYMVPKLILQPILENAFNHGLENKIEGGILKLRFEEEANGLRMIVEDNGDELNEERLRMIREKITVRENDRLVTEISAMGNIARRIAIYYGGRNYYRAERSSLGGLYSEIMLYNETALCEGEVEKCTGC